jgi:hypothetical protein
VTYYNVAHFNVEETCSLLCNRNVSLSVRSFDPVVTKVALGIYVFSCEDLGCYFEDECNSTLSQEVKRLQNCPRVDSAATNHVLALRDKSSYSAICTLTFVKPEPQFSAYRSSKVNVRSGKPQISNTPCEPFYFPSHVIVPMSSDALMLPTFS